MAIVERDLVGECSCSRSVAAVPCLLLCLFFERTTGLRVTDDEEIAGLDQTYWDTSNFGEEVLGPTARVGATVDGAPTPVRRRSGSPPRTGAVET